MAYLDIENLFNYIPVSETINIIIDKLFIDDNPNVFGLAKKSFNPLLPNTAYMRRSAKILTLI